MSLTFHFWPLKLDAFLENPFRVCDNKSVRCEQLAANYATGLRCENDSQLTAGAFPADWPSSSRQLASGQRTPPRLCAQSCHNVRRNHFASLWIGGMCSQLDSPRGQAAAHRSDHPVWQPEITSATAQSWEFTISKHTEQTDTSLAELKDNCSPNRDHWAVETCSYKSHLWMLTQGASGTQECMCSQCLLFINAVAWA